MKKQVTVLLNPESLTPIRRLNGKELAVSGVADLHWIFPEKQEAGSLELAPGSRTFLVM